MATTKTRINITVSDRVKSALTKLALRDKIPEATKAAHLLEIALEIEEDQLWDAKASHRDTKNARYLPHARVWK